MFFFFLFLRFARLRVQKNVHQSWQPKILDVSTSDEKFQSFCENKKLYIVKQFVLLCSVSFAEQNRCSSNESRFKIIMSFRIGLLHLLSHYFALMELKWSQTLLCSPDNQLNLTIIGLFIIIINVEQTRFNSAENHKNIMREMLRAFAIINNVE